MDHNDGYYLIAEKTLWASEQFTAGFFAQYGRADEANNAVAYYTGAGLTLSGLCPGRDANETGIAVARAHASHALRDANPALGDHETTIEWTYHAPINDTWSLQPGVQYIIHPGMDERIDDAIQFALRVETTF
ncbi:MAG: carbohydrate porin [Kiritimatiellae bacterium]|nr:carbohydrate porin [Kiritimatiellia bacterium]